MERLEFNAPVLLIGGGEVRAAQYRRLAPRCCAVIAADSGADRAARLGATLHAVIGDMDSIRDLARWRGASRIIADAGQDDTDLEKCLKRIAAPLIFCLGFTGDRLDHTLAVTHALCANAGRAIIAFHGGDVIFAPPRVWRARLSPGARVSIWPTRAVAALKSAGLRWPVDGLRFEAGRMIGVSNEAAAHDVSIDFDQDGAAVILGEDWLDAAIASLRGAKAE